MAGLLASRRSWSRPSTTHRRGRAAGSRDGAAGDTAPLTVPSGSSPSPGSGPTLQRQFTDRPPAPSPGAIDSGVVGRAVGGRASAAGSLPNGPTAPAGSPTAGLDDQGYPPLIARSVQRSTVGAAEAGRAPALGAAGVDVRTRTYPRIATGPAQWIQRGDLGPAGSPSRSSARRATARSRRTAPVGRVRIPRSWWPGGWRRTRPVSCPHRDVHLQRAVHATSQLAPHRPWCSAV